MADALPNSNSKLGGNPLLVVIGAMNNNEYSQQMREVAGSVELNTANKNMQNLTKAMGSINTDTGGFGWQGWLTVATVAVAVLVIGTAASFIFGPEMEVVADEIDGVIVEKTVKKVLTKATVGMLGTTMFLTGVTITIGGGLSSAKSSVKTSQFTQQSSNLNYLDQIVTNTISLVNSQLINAASQLIQGDQTAVDSALKAWGSMFVIPPVQ